MKTLNLEYLATGWGHPPVRNLPYKVVQIKNSTAYVPGQHLTKGEVDGLCRLATWEVTIK